MQRMNLRRLARLLIVLMACTAWPALAQMLRHEGVSEPGIGWSRGWVDANGDGKDDFCLLTGVNAEYLDCYLSDGSAFAVKRHTLGSGKAINTVRWSDVNGDGTTDFCRLDPAGSLRCWLGPDFGTSVSTPVPMYSDTRACPDCDPVLSPGLLDYTSEWWLADVDGDGRADLCYAHTYPGGITKDLRCQLATDTGFVPPASAWVRPSVDMGAGDWPRGFHDVNGDGFADFCRVLGSQVGCVPGGATGFAAAELRSPTLAMPNKEGAAFVDLNGDGNTDFCRLLGSGSGVTLSCLISNGLGWEAQERTSPPLSAAGDPDKRWWVDINGDGLPDYCRGSGGTLSCRLGRGDGDLNSAYAFGFSDVSLPNSSGPADLAASVDFGVGDGGRAMCDAAGTGVQTLCRMTYNVATTGQACWEGENGQRCVPLVTASYRLIAGLTDTTPQATPSLMTAYSDGAGAETRISYLPMSNRLVYTRSAGSSYPRRISVQARTPLVFETQAFQAGTLTTLTGNARYFYKDLRTDAWAGSRGFRERWVFTEGSNTLDHVVQFQGLGPAVDASSLLDDRREIGLQKMQERFAVANGFLPDATNVDPNASGQSTPRQVWLKAVTDKAMSAGALTGGAAPSTQSPFVLLQRTTHTLADTQPANPRLRHLGTASTQRWDWSGSAAVAMPGGTSTTVMDDVGNVKSLVQTTTWGGKTWRKTTTNTYGQDNRSTWLLGRLTLSSVVSEAPSADEQLAALPVSAGRSAIAAVTSVSSSSTLAPLAFGNVQAAQTTTLTATLSNPGPGTLLVTVPGAASVSGSGFSFTGTTCGPTLAVGTSCTVSVKFAPAAAQPYAGTLAVSTSAGLKSATLAGTGTSPSLAKTSTDNFSYDTPANTGSGHLLNIRNNGYGPVTVFGLSHAASSGNFNAWMAPTGSGNPTGGYCWPGAVLNPGGSCGAWANADSGAGTVSFNTSAGTVTYSGSFTARSLAYGNATGASVPVTSGQTTTLYALAINNGTPFTYYFPRLGATGTPAAVGRFSGGDAGNFVVTATNCGASLAPGASCNVSIAATGITTARSYTSSFQPNGSFQQTGDGFNAQWAGVPNWLVNMGTAIADVYVSAATPVNVTATGTLPPPPPPPPLANFSPVSGTQLTASSSQLCFEDRTYSEAAVTVTNTGGGTLTLSAMPSSATLSVSTSCTSAAAGQSCRVSIRRVLDSSAATVTVSTNGGNASYPVNGAFHPTPSTKVCSLQLLAPAGAEEAP